MKFLLDQDVYALTKTYLIESGHDVLSAAEIGLSRADDEVLLREAQHQKRILITRDRDFGNLVFVQGLGTGVIYLRMHPSTCEAVHLELTYVLGNYPLEVLRQAFVVVQKNGHRIRRIKGS
jgi:predicted nuclease of predicted toxin-antitoxin system